MPQIPSTDSDSDEMSDTTLYTLIAFGGSIHDATLVTDFVTVSKKKKKNHGGWSQPDMSIRGPS